MGGVKAIIYVGGKMSKVGIIYIVENRVNNKVYTFKYKGGINGG